MAAPDTPALPLLAGALSGFALADVLQLLELGARSGILAVDGGPRGSGSITLVRGRIVRADVDAAAGPGANLLAATVARLLDLPAGRWTFCAADGASAGPPHRTGEAVSVGAVLLEAARIRDEHPALTSSDVSADGDVPELRGISDSATKSDQGTGGALTAVHLRVLAAVDGVRDIEAIATAARAEPARVRECVTTLRALGLVSPRHALVGRGRAR